MTDTLESTEHSSFNLEKTTAPSTETTQLIEKHSHGDEAKKAGMEARATILSGLTKVAGITPEQRAVIAQYAGLVQQAEEQRMEAVVGANPVQLVHEVLVKLNDDSFTIPDLHSNSDRSYYRVCAERMNRALTGTQARLKEDLISDIAQRVQAGETNVNEVQAVQNLFNQDLQFESGVASYPENVASDVNSLIIDNVMHGLGIDKATTVRSVYDSEECKTALAEAKRTRVGNSDRSPLYTKSIPTNIPGMGTFLEVTNYGPVHFGFSMTPEAQKKMAIAPLIAPVQEPTP